MSPQYWHLRTAQELEFFNKHIGTMLLAGKKPRVKFVDQDRTTDQNGMIYAIYRQIAQQIEDQSVIDIRRECKLRYGIPILRSIDPEFNAIYDESIRDNLDYEKKLILMDFMDVTSLFKKPQATEYIDTMIREYSKQGISLISPTEVGSYV